MITNHWYNLGSKSLNLHQKKLNKNKLSWSFFKDGHILDMIFNYN